MTIAVTGAAGHLGRLVIDQLARLAPDTPVVGIVRGAARAEGLGVACRVADYDQPGTLDAALAGIDTLLLISGNAIGQRVPQHGNVIAAARRAGVERIVYTSLLRADTSPLSLAPEHAQTEALLKTSGIDWTILRNGWYNENYSGAIAQAAAHGTLVGSAGAGRIAAAARADYAEAAAVVLTRAGHAATTYELAGDEAFTLAELAAEVARQSGRPVAFENLPEADYAAVLKDAGLPAAFAAGIASWDSGAAQGALFDAQRQLSQLIGRPTTPLADTVRQVLA